MSKTRQEIKEEWLEAIGNCMNFDTVIDKTVDYIVKNFTSNKKGSAKEVDCAVIDEARLGKTYDEYRTKPFKRKG